MLGVTVPTLSLSGALEAIGQEAKAWSEQFEGHLMQFEFFKAGIELGRALGLVLGLLEAGAGLAKVFPKLARKGAALAAELPARISALAKRGDPAAVATLAKEISAMDALSAVDDIANGAKVPFKVKRADLKEVLQFGGMKETANGGIIMRVPCSH